MRQVGARAPHPPDRAARRRPPGNPGGLNREALERTQRQAKSHRYSHHRDESNDRRRRRRRREEDHDDYHSSDDEEDYQKKRRRRREKDYDKNYDDYEDEFGRSGRSSRSSRDKPRQHRKFSVGLGPENEKRVIYVFAFLQILA